MDIKTIMEFVKRVRKCLPRRPRPRCFDAKFARNAAFFGSPKSWKRAAQGRLIRFSLCCLGGMALVLTLYLLSGLWKVTEVTAQEGELYSSAMVLECAELETGRSMLSFDSFGVARELRERLPLLKNVKVRRHLRGSVTISFEEETEVFYTQHHTNYYMISAETREVLCVDALPAEAKRVGAVYLGLPEATRVRVGEELSFINLPYEPVSAPVEVVTYELETEEPAVENAYVFEFVEALMSSPLAPRVTGMELGDRYDLWFVLDGSIKVKIGNMDELDRKLTVTERSLQDRAEEGFVSGGLPTLVDVSDPARIIHRTSPDIGMPPWAK